MASESEQIEYKNMMSSINEYKGFYIGRYETSNNGEDKVQSKKNVLPWTDIKFANSMTDLSGGIVEKTREMYPEVKSKKGNAVSTVVYGICWDEIVRFIRKNYPDVEKNSMNYGNLLGTNGNVAIPTGSKEEYAQNNIYDMGGNVLEKTMEVFSNKAPVVRGGLYVSEFWIISSRIQRANKF